MKRAVSVSLDASKRDKVVEADFLGRNGKIQRTGTDGDMGVIRTSIVTGQDELWNNLIDARKNAFKYALFRADVEQTISL